MELLDKDKEFLEAYKRYVLKGPNIYAIGCLISFVAVLSAGVFETLPLNISFLCCLLIAINYACGAIIIQDIKWKKIMAKYHIGKLNALTHYYNLLDVKSMYYLPFFEHICRLNPDAKSTQIELIKKWYSIEEKVISDYVIDREYSKEDWDNAVEQLKDTELGTKKTFIHRLFQLSILEDGIHNDEWKLLMQLITDLRFNKNYINYFKERYNPLRTEFDESEWKGNSSTTYVLASPKEYYDVLGLTEGASYEEIKRAYHELALQHHPDLPKNAGRTEECEKMMMKINEAYEKLRSKS